MLLDYNSQRLWGLQLLDMVGAPTPRWQLVTNERDIRQLRFWRTQYGWTVRTCRTDGIREMGLFYANYVRAAEMRRLLAKQIQQHGRERMFLVYPSWKFVFACNVVCVGCDVFIEGLYSSQKALAMGTEVPDFSLRLPFGYRSRLQVLHGTKTKELTRWIGTMVFRCKKTQLDELYAEVALMESGAIVFYELFDLGRSGARAMGAFRK